MTGVVLERVVDWQDTDAAGHYHHSTVIRWVEAAEAAFLDRFGLRWLFGRIPRVRYEVDYLDRLWFGDIASITLTVGHLGRTSVRYDFVITRIRDPRQHPADPPTVAARGTVIAVHADDEAQPWPASVVTALGDTREE
ncbi:acyl-CoA thioesterase [Nocardia terpenica]|uniref:acyl-CoA thioesterase n=1 Tax=Nocardia terpenica TaxID=455432 RepID=UPI0018E09677|nr:thioesterase family protein [Nocardia terpenica]